MSDTPRTDERYCDLVRVAVGVDGWITVAAEMKKHGDTLELELSAARREIQTLVVELGVARMEITELKSSEAAHMAVCGKDPR